MSNPTRFAPALAVAALALVAAAPTADALSFDTGCIGDHWQDENDPRAEACAGIWHDGNRLTCVGYYVRHADGRSECMGGAAR